MKKLEYQEKAVELAKEKKRLYLAMDTGTGKTITSLLCAKAVEGNVLLVAELNEIERSQNFKKEVEKYFDDVFEFVNLREKDEGETEKRKIYAVNPEKLTRMDIDQLNKKVNILIVDESTLAKEVGSQRSKAIFKVAERVEYAFLLSATPMMNSCRELYAPMRIIRHSLLSFLKEKENTEAKAKKKFEEIFAGGHYRQIRSLRGVPEWERKKYWWKYYAWWAKGANNVELLRFLLSDKFYFVKKENTGLFKKKIRVIKKVPVNDEWAKESALAWEEYFEELKKDEKNWQVKYSRFKREYVSKIDNVQELRQLIEKGKMYQVNSRWKIKEVVKDIENEFKNERVIVFVYFVESEIFLKDELIKRGISFGTFDELDEWKKSNKKVLIGRIKAHGKGGNVPEANITLFVDMSPVPAENIQCENRMDRPEQEKDMIVRYYIANDDVDKWIREINRQKQNKINRFMNEPKPEVVLEQNEKIKEKWGVDFLRELGRFDELEEMLHKG